MRYYLVGISALALAGCATTSFAPPRVNMDRELQSKGTQTFFNATCTPKEVGQPGANKKDVNSALWLVSNFILTYRCQADRAAEGRQFFEVPGFLTAAGAATASAFGAGAGVAIGAGATGAVLNQGKSYYAPRDKAAVLNDGLDALLCIQNEAVGIDAYTLNALSAAQADSGQGADGSNRALAGSGTAAAGEDDSDASISLSSDRQYFEMVRTALFAVERVVAQRLSAAGTPFDAAGVIAEIERLNQQQAEQKDEAGDAETAGQDAKTAANADASSPPQPETRPDGTLVPTVLPSATMTRAQLRLAARSDADVGRTVIKLKTLQPKLDKCVVRAKV